MMRFFYKRANLLASLSVLLFAAEAGAVDITVTTDADSGTGSLRDAINQAASGDRIVFEIPGTPTIQLLSDLPTISVDISFANNNLPDVTIDRNGFGPLSFTGALVDPSIVVTGTTGGLIVNTGGAASPDADLVAAASTTVFGAGAVNGNLVVPGTLAPGADATAGSIGTFSVTGDFDLTTAQVELDLSATGGTLTNDLISVVGTTTVTNAVLAPNFIGNQFEIGQQFLVLDATNPISGVFLNAGDAFALPDNPFLQAVQDTTLAADDFGFVIEDNGDPFTTIVSGCNQTSAAELLDQLQASATPPAGVTALRNGSTEQVLLAVNQLSGSIYPSLIGAEIFHIQNNLESVRDRVVLQVNSRPNNLTLRPWIRGYGVAGHVDQDSCQTLGYRHEVGGVEIGCGLSRYNGLAAYTFAHLASGQLDVRGVDQRADIDSYRLGGSLEYIGQTIYALAAGGAGVQDYDVRRSLNAIPGSSFAESSLGGSAQFGYFELGTIFIEYETLVIPYLALHATRVELDPISEIGDPDFALISDGGAGDSLRGVLGISLNESGMTPVGIATTNLRFGWMHEYLDEPETFLSQVADGGTPTGSLRDRGATAGTHWGFLRAQVDMGMLLGGTFSVSYQGQYNHVSSFSALLAGTQWIF